MEIKRLSFCFTFFALCFLLFVTGGCAKKKNKPVEKVEVTQTVVIPPLVPKPEPIKKIVYSYQGNYFPDPFVPLNFGSSTGKKSNNKLTANNLRSFKVKGIIEDLKGKFVLFNGPGGKNYILKEGKLIDPEGKTIPEIKGVVEKNKIVFFMAETKVELNITEENR